MEIIPSFIIKIYNSRICIFDTPTHPHELTLHYPPLSTTLQEQAKNMDKKGFHPLRSNDNPDLLAAFILSLIHI